VGLFKGTMSGHGDFAGLFDAVAAVLSARAVEILANTMSEFGLRCSDYLASSACAALTILCVFDRV
jgi:hypothetical protein